MNRRVLTVAVATVLLGGCAAQQSLLPPPRPLIIRSGARLQAEPERMEEINKWVPIELDSIRVDPSFWIITAPETEPVLLWEGLEISNDSATIKVQAVTNEVVRSYMIYAHLHLMRSLGRQAVWVAEAPDADGFDFERAVLKRVSDTWFFARSSFDAIPYEPLDELLFSNENGFLDAYILTMRPDEFEEEREAFTAANPTALEEYLQWFQDTFRRLPTSATVGSGG